MKAPIESPESLTIGSVQAPPLFTAIPGENDPLKLRFDYQKQLLDSLKIYLKKIEKTFAVRFCLLSEKLEKIDPSKRLSPAIFSAYVHIREGYSNKDVHSIFDMLQMLKNLECEELYATEFQCTTILTEAWEYPLMSYLRQAHPRDEEGKLLFQEIRILPLLNWDNESFPPPEVRESIELIKQVDEGLSKEIESYVSSIKLFSGRVMEGVTSPRFFGNIYLRLPFMDEDPLLFYLEHIVHEVSHLHLYAMMGQDPFVLNPDTEKFASPLRSDKRPMSGIFHAHFVLCRIIRIMRKIAPVIRPVNQNVKNLPQAVLESAEKAFADTCMTITDNARLTTAGWQVFESTQRCAKEETACVQRQEASCLL